MDNYKKLLTLLFITTIASSALAQSLECGQLAPHATDYRSAKPEHKAIVENAHFTHEVETLKSGKSALLGGDLNFTLTTFPNHPRALIAMMNLSLARKMDKPVGAEYTVDCYFERAIRFRPDDGMVRMIHGIYLSKRGKKMEAIKELEEARLNTTETPNQIYNLGLAYFEVKDYEKSLALAQEAYRLGYPLDGLRKKLTAIGKWREQAILTSPKELETTQEKSTEPNPPNALEKNSHQMGEK